MLYPQPLAFPGNCYRPPWDESLDTTVQRKRRAIDRISKREFGDDKLLVLRCDCDLPERRELGLLRNPHILIKAKKSGASCNAILRHGLMGHTYHEGKRPGATPWNRIVLAFDHSPTVQENLVLSRAESERIIDFTF
jgi:hypothetical protein